MTGRILLLLIGLGVATCSGCLHRHATDMTLMENELRWMEDQVYKLEDELQRKQRQLANCQAATQGLGGYTVVQDYAVTDVCPVDSTSPNLSPQYEIIPPSGSSPNLQSTPRTPRDEPTPADRPSDSQYEILNENDAPRFAPDRATTEPPAELDLKIEEVEPPGSSDNSDADMLTPPEITIPPDDRSTRANPAGGIGFISHDEELESTEDAADAHVTHVVVKAWLAHGHGFDGLERECDLLVCVEPRNANGHVVPLGSELSLVVLDATKTGEEARIARWDYTAAEARRLLRRTDAGNGIHLELPWPKDIDVASNAELHIFARYITVEDQLLEADARIADAFRGPEAVARAGWQRAQRKDASTDEDDIPGELKRVRSKIKLRPIPKESNDSEEGPRIPRTEEQPTILDEDDQPSWSPER